MSSGTDLMCFQLDKHPVKDVCKGIFFRGYRQTVRPLRRRI